MQVSSVLVPGVQASLGVVVFAAGMASPRGGMVEVVRHPAPLLRSLLAMQVLAPVLAVSLAATLPFNRDIKLALAAVALSPAVAVLPAADLAREQRTRAAALIGASALLSILSLPVTFTLLSGGLGLQWLIRPAAFAERIVFSTLLPLGAGLLLARVWPAFSARWCFAVARTGALLLVLALVPSIIILLPEARQATSNLTFLVLASYTMAGLLIGGLLGGPGLQDRTALAVSTTARHPAFALSLAGSAVGDGQAATTAILIVLMVATAAAAPYAALARRRYRLLPTRRGMVGEP